jgi:hypothetical protein
MTMTQEFFDELRKRMSAPGNIETVVRIAPPVPNATAIEALRLMRDTTQSRDQYARAVEALKQMGVSDE